jgi:hypothetical protein
VHEPAKVPVCSMLAMVPETLAVSLSTINVWPSFAISRTDVMMVFHLFLFSALVGEKGVVRVFRAPFYSKTQARSAKATKICRLQQAWAA